MIKKMLDRFVAYDHGYSEAQMDCPGDPALAVVVVCFFSIVLVFLPGCQTVDLDAPSVVNTQPIRLQESAYSEEFTVKQAVKHSASIAQRFRQYGGGELQVEVLYNPELNGGEHALNQAERIAGLLRGFHVRDLRATALPVHGVQERVLVSYRSYEALAPQDCAMMPGYYSARVVHDPNYKIGCSVETLFAKQVARPKDLAGVADLDVADGRRAANLADIYRSGAVNQPLNGESASE